MLKPAPSPLRSVDMSFEATHPKPQVNPNQLSHLHAHLPFPFAKYDAGHPIPSRKVSQYSTVLQTDVYHAYE